MGIPKISNQSGASKKGLLSNNDFFEALYKFFAVNAVALTVAPYCYLFFFMGLGVNPVFSFLFTVLLMWFGYGLQAVYSSITKVKREEGGAAYERGVRYFKPKAAVLTITAVVLLSTIAYSATHAYLRHLVDIGRLLFYDPDSLAPIIAMAVVLAPMYAGIVTWFYPYDRIVSSKTIFVFLAAHLISLILSFVFPVFTTVCFILFLLSALVIFNQSYLIQLVDKSKIGLLTPQMRFYNIALVCIALIAVSVTMLFVVTVVIGIVILFRILLYFTLASVLRDDSTVYQKAETVAESAGGEIFSDFLGISGGANMQFIFAVFCMLVFAVILFFIFIRKVNIVKIIGRFLNVLYSNIIEFLTNLFYFNRTVTSKVEYTDYTDDERQVTTQTYRASSQQTFKPRRTYRDFMHRLNSLKTHPEKLTYAYNTLVTFWTGMEFMIRPSDTPREIRDKVKSRSEIKNVDEMTELFERVKYAGDSDVDNGLLEEMCAILRRYYD